MDDLSKIQNDLWQMEFDRLEQIIAVTSYGDQQYFWKIIVVSCGKASQGVIFWYFPYKISIFGVICTKIPILGRGVGKVGLYFFKAPIILTK